jgi:methionyl-tRNA formyltransferase
MNLVFLGSGSFGIECLDVVADSHHNISFIVTQPAGRAGRGRKSRPTAVSEWAGKNSVPYSESLDVNSIEQREQIASYNPDLILVIAFGQKIGNELIELAPKGMINVHASLVPKYRGAAPLNWAIINGDRQTGVSIITVVEKMDAGDIIAQAKTDIGPNETAGELHDRLGRLAGPLLIETLDKIETDKSDGFLNFSDSAQSLRQRILGTTPWPGASAMYISGGTNKSQRVIITMAHVVECSNRSGLSIGTLDENLHVICGSDALKIDKIKPASGSVMDFGSFVNGHRLRPGDKFTGLAD